MRRKPAQFDPAISLTYLVSFWPPLARPGPDPLPLLLYSSSSSFSVFTNTVTARYFVQKGQGKKKRNPSEWVPAGGAERAELERGWNLQLPGRRQNQNQSSGCARLSAPRPLFSAQKNKNKLLFFLVSGAVREEQKERRMSEGSCGALCASSLTVCVGSVWWVCVWVCESPLPASLHSPALSSKGQTTRRGTHKHFRLGRQNKSLSGEGEVGWSWKRINQWDLLFLLVFKIIHC